MHDLVITLPYNPNYKFPTKTQRSPESIPRSENVSVRFSNPAPLVAIH